jgi:UDP:flavonoid glycosyltransferase YjiC (YdhE family)
VMRILFTACPMGGHVNTLLPLGLAAERSGHTVAFATGVDLADRVERSGLVLPQGADQPANAAAVQRAGAGLALETVTAERVGAAAQQLLADPGYAARAREIGAEIAAMTDADAVVSEL